MTSEDMRYLFIEQLDYSNSDLSDYKYIPEISYISFDNHTTIPFHDNSKKVKFDFSNSSLYIQSNDRTDAYAFSWIAAIGFESKR